MDLLLSEGASILKKSKLCFNMCIWTLLDVKEIVFFTVIIVISLGLRNGTRKVRCVWLFPASFNIICETIAHMLVLCHYPV